MRGAVPIVLLLLMASATFSAGQDSGQVTVLRAGDNELQRTAFRLRLCAGDLENLRHVLAEAALVAPEVAQEVDIGELGRYYTWLDPVGAEGALSAVLLQLRRQAAAASMLQEYQNLSAAAHQLNSRLWELNPRLAEELEEAWPEPPENLPEAFPILRSRGDLLRMARVAQVEPERALQQLSQYEQGQANFSMRTAILSGLSQQGAHDAMDALIEETLAVFASELQENADEALRMSLLNFMTMAAHTSPAQLADWVDVFGVAIQSLQRQGGLQTYAVPVGGETVEMTASEKLTFDALKRLRQFPEASLRVLAAEPTLRSKLEALGGLDRALARPRGHVQSHVAGARVRSVTTALRRQGELDVESLRVSVEGERIEAQDLVHHLQNSCGRRGFAPAGANDAFQAIAEVAASLALEMPEPSSSARIFMQLVPALARCEGGVDSGILDQGFHILERLRQEASDGESGAVTGGKRGSVGSALALESALLSAFALTDFPAGIARIRAVESPLVRYQAMMEFIGLFLNR